MASTKHFRLPSFQILLIAFCMTLIGCFLLPRLPVKLAPDKSLANLSVSFSMRDMSARVVEMEVTSKLEGMLSRIKGVEKVYSSSGSGWGWVGVDISKNMDIDVVRFEISTLIRQLYPSLPSGVSYPTVSARRSDESSSRPFLTYVLNAPSTPILIQKFAENSIKNQLAYLEGIDEVNISGASPAIWRLEYDYAQLRRQGLSVQDLQDALNTYLEKEYLGTVMTDVEKEPSKHQWIRLMIAPENHTDRFDPSLVIVRNISGKLIRLNQLVKVSYQEDEPSSYFRINGLNSIYLSIKAKAGVNQLQLAQNVKKSLQKMEASFPPNYEIHLAYDATEYIREELRILLFRSGLTILILLAFVFLIYRNLRYLGMIAFSLIVNLAVAVVFYKLLKLEMHLYSLMGITISLNLLLDNIIVMSDQIHRQKNRNAFLAILTATLTTMAALVMIFFMDERTRLNLQDFAEVIMINLGVSLIVVLWLVPALMEKFNLTNSSRKKSNKGKRAKVRFNRLYSKFIGFTTRKRTWVALAGILLFGLPVFMLPDEIKPEEEKELSSASVVYNKTLGSEFYRENIKPIANVALGGTLRLFVEKVYEGSYWKDNQETTLNVTLSMPNGSTLLQTNQLIQQMETYLRLFPQIKQFQTNVETRRASIDIRFSREDQLNSFPYFLKSELISKAVELGGGSWGVFGLGDGFSNDLRENAGSYQIKLLGYNYDELYTWAEIIRDSLLRHRRIKEVTIDSELSWYKKDYEEFMFNLNKERLIQYNLRPQELFGDMSPMFGRGWYAGSWIRSEGSDPIRLYSKESNSYDIWRMKNFESRANTIPYRLDYLAHIEKVQAPPSIVRENQQYKLCLQYEYIGAYEQGSRVLDYQIENFKKILPLGYSIASEKNNGYREKNGKQYLLLLIVVILIYFTTSILFNSLKQPFAILLIIPVSYIGLFLTFFLFRLNFDQGGFASFILLSGITVNAGIYVVNQYKIIQKNKRMTPIRAYLRAWNLRIVPISLTILSTVLGFVPFLIGEKEGFWFPLAAGTIGGLIFSIIGLFVCLPIFLGIVAKQKRRLPC